MSRAPTTWLREYCWLADQFDRSSACGVLRLEHRSHSRSRWPARLARIHSVEPGCPVPSPDAYCDTFVAPECRQSTRRRFERARCHPDADFELEWLIVGSHGARRPLAARLRAFRGPGGDALLLAVRELTGGAGRGAEAAAVPVASAVDPASETALAELAHALAHQLSQPLAAIANYASAASRLAARLDPAESAIREPLAASLVRLAEQVDRAAVALRHLRSAPASPLGAVPDADRVATEVAP
ncbi:MAG: hypothetical protein O9284_09120 [Steroidobacteraceae bacterium]|jgi:hypothetical protein|nr:hypothetical protein [Steroidobacteraceae bacterium]